MRVTSDRPTIISPIALPSCVTRSGWVMHSVSGGEGRRGNRCNRASSSQRSQSTPRRRYPSDSSLREAKEPSGWYPVSTSRALRYGNSPLLQSIAQRGHECKQAASAMLPARSTGHDASTDAEPAAFVISRLLILVGVRCDLADVGGFARPATFPRHNSPWNPRIGCVTWALCLIVPARHNSFTSNRMKESSGVVT